LLGPPSATQPHKPCSAARSLSPQAQSDPPIRESSQIVRPAGFYGTRQRRFGRISANIGRLDARLPKRRLSG
jgi:hypothetical protein